MCLILLAYKVHPRYPFILAANRDEFHQRPTRGIHWWSKDSALLAGKDLQRGGTWLGLSRRGGFAAVTNVREGKSRHSSKKSRGQLPLDFLRAPGDVDRFSRQLIDSREQYSGYNLLFGTCDQLYYYSNRQDRINKLGPAVYGLSNARLDTPWPKVATGKSELTRLSREPDPAPDQLFGLLESTEQAPDHLLPDTGVGLGLERLLSATCIVGEQYGTRSSCVALIDQSRQVRLYAKERAPVRGPVEKFDFMIDCGL